jgi:hypothetical protein
MGKGSMVSVEQDDLRSAAEALRNSLRLNAEDFAKYCDLRPRKYVRWESGDVDLSEPDLSAIRLGMLAIAQQQKVVVDECLAFARRHQDLFMLTQPGHVAQA